jgi:quercetin dioxygenase-like cupin family protein
MFSHRPKIRVASFAAMASVLTAVVTSATLLAQAQKTDSSPTGHESTTTGKVLAQDHEDMQNTRVRFEPGARTHWHSHAGGQVLVVQEGNGRMQQAGGPIREMAPGDAIFTAPGVAHWHGADPNRGVVLLSFYIGKVTWQQPVAESEYLGKPKK